MLEGMCLRGFKNLCYVLEMKLFTGLLISILVFSGISCGESSSDYNSYDERLARCYISEERPGYDFSSGGSNKDYAAMATCLSRVKE